MERFCLVKDRGTLRIYDRHEKVLVGEPIETKYPTAVSQATRYMQRLEREHQEATNGDRQNETDGTLPPQRHQTA